MHVSDSNENEFTFTGKMEIVSKSGDGSLVWGWLSVTEIDGETYVDTQDDVIKANDLVSPVHEFMKNARVAKVAHEGVQKGEFVEAVVITDAVVEAWKQDGTLKGDITKRGWWGCVEVSDPATRKLVKSGKLRSFSIGGTGVREKMEDAA